MPREGIPGAIQDLSSFRLPKGFRGRSLFCVQLWWTVQATVFRWSPLFAFGFRRWLLRLFGAEIGKKVLVPPSATVIYPWRLSIGDNSWIGEGVVLYTLAEIQIGKNVVISQCSYLCTGSHDYSLPDFPTFTSKISIEPEAWLGAGVFVAPGVTVGQGAVIGARSEVFADMPPRMVCFGHPCRPVKERKTRPLPE